jgi:hypothetical protein
MERVVQRFDCSGSIAPLRPHRAQRGLCQRVPSAALPHDPGSVARVNNLLAISTKAIAIAERKRNC